MSSFWQCQFGSKMRRGVLLMNGGSLCSLGSLGGVFIFVPTPFGNPLSFGKIAPVDYFVWKSFRPPTSSVYFSYRCARRQLRRCCVTFVSPCHRARGHAKTVYIQNIPQQVPSQKTCFLGKETEG